MVHTYKLVSNIPLFIDITFAAQPVGFMCVNKEKGPLVFIAFLRRQSVYAHQDSQNPGIAQVIMLCGVNLGKRFS